MWSKLQSSQQVCLNMTKQASGPPEPNKQTCPNMSAHRLSNMFVKTWLKQASGPPEPKSKARKLVCKLDKTIFLSAGNTWRGYSRLRSGREHWAWMVVVEVRQGTLGGDGRGWGPAGNTGRGWSWLRSDREHCASRVAVEQEEEERRGGEEQATDIKSNNPHLAGGEKYENWKIGHHFLLTWPLPDGIRWKVCRMKPEIDLGTAVMNHHFFGVCPQIWCP